MACGDSALPDMPIAWSCSSLGRDYQASVIRMYGTVVHAWKWWPKCVVKQVCGEVTV